MVPIGRIGVDAPGYVRVDIQGIRRDGATFGSFDALEVRSETEDVSLAFVRNNQGNMFYWGRRGPSAHLRYDVPSDRTIQYAYNEIFVPRGEDPIGPPRFSVAFIRSSKASRPATATLVVEPTTDPLGSETRKVSGANA